MDNDPLERNVLTCFPPSQFCYPVVAKAAQMEKDMAADN